MDFYIDIQLKPNAEMPINRLLNVMYTKFHRALHDLKSNSIGVSFPAYNVLLGNKLRIHGSAANLAAIQQLNWIGGLISYCEVSQLLVVPPNHTHRTVSRKQSTMSKAKLNRLLKRGSIAKQGAKQYKTKMFTNGLDNPYLVLVSGSSGHKHRRYIEFGELVTQRIIGEFDHFGLSKTATVPWF
jgi:CRISPR-associated endonuclease Csy4